MFNGEVKITAQGKERVLKFGTWSTALFCESEKIPLKQMNERLMNPGPFTQINLVHSAAVAYCDLNKMEVDFKLQDVSIWIDEVGETEMAEKIVDAMKTYGTPKN